MLNIISRQSTLDQSAPVFADKAAHNHSGWIDLIINENYPPDGTGTFFLTLHLYLYNSRRRYHRRLLVTSYR